MATITARWDRHRTGLLILLLLAAAFRLSLLGSKSLWFDEAFSVRAAHSPERLWTPATTRPETHPPLYYQGLHYWVDWFGDSETAVRLPSAFASLINVGLIYVLGRRLFNRRVAQIAAALLALSPLHVWYAQEARMYVFMTTVMILSAVLLTWNSWWALLPLTAIFSFGLYIDYTMLPIWYLLSALWLVWWWKQGHARRPFLIWAAASILSWLTFLPWLSNFYAVLDIFNDIHLFLRMNELLGIPFMTPGQYLLIMALLGALLVPAASLLSELLRREETRTWVSALVIAAFLLATLLFPVPRLYGIKRLLVQVWPLMIMLVAWILDQTDEQGHRLTRVVVAASLAASLVVLIAVPKDDWRGAVAYVNGRAAEGDLALLSPTFNRTVASYYQLVPPITFALDDLEAHDDGTIWFFAERFPGEQIPSTPAEAFLNGNFKLVETAPFYRLEVQGYQIRDGE